MNYKQVIKGLALLHHQCEINLLTSPALVIGEAAKALADAYAPGGRYIDVMITVGELEQYVHSRDISFMTVTSNRLGLKAIDVDDNNTEYEFRLFGYEAAVIESFYKEAKCIDLPFRVHYSKELVFAEAKEEVKVDEANADPHHLFSGKPDGAIGKVILTSAGAAFQSHLTTGLTEGKRVECRVIPDDDHKLPDAFEGDTLVIDPGHFLHAPTPSIITDVLAQKHAGESDGEVHGSNMEPGIMSDHFRSKLEEEGE